MTSGLYPLLAWLRERIAETSALALMAKDHTDGVWASWSNATADIALYSSDGKLTQGVHKHIAHHDPAAALAQCEAHTKLLDLVEQSAVPEIKLKPGADEADYVAIFLDYKMHDFAVAVALAYQHHPEYTEQMAALKAHPHEFQIARADDELSKRRNPPSPQ